MFTVSSADLDAIEMDKEALETALAGQKTKTEQVEAAMKEEVASLTADIQRESKNNILLLHGCLFLIRRRQHCAFD